MNEKRKKHRIGQIVKVNPEEWRERKPYLGKIREFTQSGVYVSQMLGKKYAKTTSIYYDMNEIGGD